MLAAAGFTDIVQLDQRLNPRNDYTEWASFSAVNS